jgi:hypothetical protein
LVVQPVASRYTKRAIPAPLYGAIKNKYAPNCTQYIHKLYTDKKLDVNWHKDFFFNLREINVYTGAGIA